MKKASRRNFSKSLIKNFQKSYKKFFDVWKILLLFYILSKEISLQQSLTIFREKFGRRMEKHTRLLHERAEASKIAQCWTGRAKTKKVHVLRSIVVPHADSGEQEVLSDVRSDKRSMISRLSLTFFLGVPRPSNLRNLANWRKVRMRWTTQWSRSTILLLTAVPP